MKQRVLKIIIFCTIIFECIFSQVVVTPPFVLLKSPRRSASYVVDNRSDKAQEIAVRFQFGYPVSDSLGNMSMMYQDSAAEKKYSIAKRLNAFPKRFLLQPGQQQTVRLNIQAPSDFVDGMYWTRIITKAVPDQAFIDTLKTGITTTINFAFEQVTTAAYASGNLTTAMQVEWKEVKTDSQNVIVLWRAVKDGNSPFLGIVKVKLYDSQNNLIHETFETVGIYLSMMKRAVFPREFFEPQKTYTIELQCVAERTDIPVQEIVPMETVTSRFNFTLP